MTLEFAQQLVQAAEQHDIPLRLIPSYSGRGMYGKSTAAVVFSDPGDLAAAALALGGSTTGADRESAIEELRGLGYDSMGRDKVAY